VDETSIVDLTATVERNHSTCARRESTIDLFYSLVSRRLIVGADPRTFEQLVNVQR
jgi:hypothetical protein